MDGRTTGTAVADAGPEGAARRVAEVAAEHAEETERLRRLAPPVAEALEASGLAGLQAPRALGGDGAGADVVVRVVEAIALGDASTAWVAGIGMGSNFLAGYIPEDGARSVFTDVRRPACGPFAPTGRAEAQRGGPFRLSGRWPFASGCQVAAVQVAGTFTFDDGAIELGPAGPVHRLVAIPMSAVEIEETWNTTGMRGTGSHDTVVRGTAVEAEQFMQLGDESWCDDPSFRQPEFAGLGPCLAAVPLGLARAALERWAAVARAQAEDPPLGGRPALGDDPISQDTFGRAEVRLRSARALLLELTAEGHELGRRGDPVPREHVALVALACRQAVEAAGDVLDTVLRMLGSSTVREHSWFDRARRDMDTLRQHIMFSPGVMAPMGRQVAGLPTFAPPFLARPLGS